jgi:hypothetical protein
MTRRRAINDFRGIAIDPDDPPTFESQAAYLKRHGLFLAGEARRMKKAEQRELILSSCIRKLGRLSLESTMDDKDHIDFDAPATLRKWPSVRNERVSNSRPYLVSEGTLDDCIRQFMAKPISQHHLYEIHTAPQGEPSQRRLVSETYC